MEFPGVDICACCGTQVKYTGEIGLVKIFSCVKFHEGVRIEMACGGRAFNLLSAAYQQNKLVSQTFSAKILETGAAAARMNEALAAEKFRANGLEKQLYNTIAQNYAGQTLAVHFEDSLSPAANRALCDTLAGYCEIAVTLSGSDETGYSLCIVSLSGDAKAIGAAATAALGGKGGGKREAFQGNISATRQEISDFFQSQKII